MRVLFIFLHPVALAAAAAGGLVLGLYDWIPGLRGGQGPSVFAAVIAYGFYIYAVTCILWVFAALFRSGWLARSSPILAWVLACVILAAPFVLGVTPRGKQHRSILGWTETEATLAVVTLPGYLAYEWFEQG